MKRIILLLLIFLPTLMFGRHAIKSTKVKSLQVVVNNNWLSMPVMQMGTNDVLNISFDELSHEYHRFIVHLEHCEADWTPSTDLFESNWLQGFNDQPIEDYENSLNTTVLYTHYKYQIPNDQCRLTMSGNYRLHILDEDNDNQEILVAEFRVVEHLMDVGLGVSTNTDIDQNGAYQQLSMTVNYNSLSVTNPDNQLQIIVMQNGREDNAKKNVRPNYITPRNLRWEHNRALIFNAGNEYHKFEVLDPSHTTMGLDHVWWDEDVRFYHVYPYLYEPQTNYLYDEDADGAFYIRNSNNIDNDTQSDYVYVHYTLRPWREYQDTQLIIDGQWTNEDPMNYFMYYNDETHCYHATILQKMGYYNYQVRMLDPDGITHPLPEEGAFYQTENRYQAFVYYKGTGERTWRLVGYQEIKFFAQ